MKWTFIIPFSSSDNLTDVVKQKSEKVVQSVGKSKEGMRFGLQVTFYQKRERWKKGNPMMPREDWGLYLDDKVKDIVDGLGPIIGYRQDWDSDEPTQADQVLASKIIEIEAKKVNTGSSDDEYISIEIDSL